MNHVYVFANGIIEIGTRVPSGAIKIASHENEEILIDAIAGTARLSYDNKRWIAPEIRDTQKDGGDKLKALLAYQKRLIAAIRVNEDEGLDYR